jgi:hypothetical protein
MESVLEIVDLSGSTTTRRPDQSGVSSVLWQFGQILPVVSVWHFLHANSFGVQITLAVNQKN